MWVRRAAIRAIPPYARVPTEVLERVEGQLAGDDEESEERLGDAFSRFERTQPALSSRVAAALARPSEETALALGYFLSLAVWISFEQTFAERLRMLGEEDVEATAQALAFDEELRRDAADEAIETDDVVAMGQPDLVAFVREHIDVAVEANAASVEIDDVDRIYRLILLEIVALSDAVAPPAHHPGVRVDLSALKTALPVAVPSSADFSPGRRRGVVLAWRAERLPERGHTMKTILTSKATFLALTLALAGCSSSSSGDDTSAGAGGSGTAGSGTAGTGGTGTGGTGTGGTGTGGTAAGAGGSTGGAGGSTAGAGGSTGGAGGATGGSAGTGGGAGGSTGGAGGGAAAPTCADYCSAVQTNCTGDKADYTSPEACSALCAGLPVGTLADTSGDTVGCRLYHAKAAAADSTLHCPHAGLEGGGVCGTDACTAFCEGVKTVCTGTLAPYASDAECKTACGKFAVGTGPLAAATSGDTLLCRVYHLEAGAVSPAAAMTHCSHVGAVSPVCK
jgi:hypothetical protein